MFVSRDEFLALAKTNPEITKRPKSDNYFFDGTFRGDRFQQGLQNYWMALNKEMIAEGSKQHKALLRDDPEKARLVDEIAEQWADELFTENRIGGKIKMSLARDYRPKSLKHIYGNEQLKKDLLPFVKQTREMPGAILLTGPSGCGKTTIARILARSGGCSESDIIELDIADFRGIDTVRDIRRQMRLAPLGGDSRCWILDEAHKMTDDAQNALLKALEEPPSNVFFILCTTDPQKLIKTIITRCVQFEVEPIPVKDLIDIMKDICQGEDVVVPDEVLTNIAKNASASGRAAINSLERLLGREPKDFDKQLDYFDAKETEIKELCQAMLTKKKWPSGAKIISGIKEEPESIRRACLGYMNAILLSGKDNVQAAHIIECLKEPVYNSGRAGLTLACYYSVLSE